MDWPPIPAEVMGILGPITVRLVEQALDDEGQTSQGTWRSNTRTIEITITGHPANDWWTLYHELAHSYLDDLRITLPAGKEERVCDAVGVGRLHEMLDTLK